MKRIKLLFAVLCLSISLSAVYAQNAVAKDLSWAKSLMERGDYVYAAEKFENIVRSQYAPPVVKKEAMYYVGYCHVKNNDPWQAVRVFERFLEKYDDGISREFIPDALYVLGRVYEETGDQKNAIKVYRRCSRNYPRNSFATKSAERLTALGMGGSGATDPFDDTPSNGGNDYGHSAPGNTPGYGSGHHDSGSYSGGSHGNTNHHGGTHSGISPEIRQLLRVAETISSNYSKDEMLIDGADQAMSGEDFVALAKAICYDSSRATLLEKVRKNKNYGAFTVKSMIELASFVKTSYAKDEFLSTVGLDFAKRDYASGFDFVDISKAISSSSTRRDFIESFAKTSAFKLLSARTVVDLANTCNSSYDHDDLLVMAAKQNGYPRKELLILAEACSSSFNKSEILEIAHNAAGNSSHGGHYRGQPAVSRSVVESDSLTNPFSGFSFDESKLKRIKAFVGAVNSKKNTKEAVSQLKKSDLSNSTVREYMGQFRKMQKFEDIHQSR